MSNNEGANNTAALEALDRFVSGGNDQPETCSKCGSRTDFEEVTLDGKTVQHHTCLDCGYQFILEDDEEDYLYRCPNCEEVHDLVVAVTVWAEVVQSTPGNMETDIDSDVCPDHDQEWGGNSSMKCSACGYTGPARLFEVDGQKEHEEREYNVSVSRTGYSGTDITVLATSRVKAENKALEVAGDIEFSDDSADYQVENAYVLK